MSRRRAVPIVVCSLEAWDETWRRNQYLVDAILRADPSVEFLFVEPPTDPVHALSRGRRPRRGSGMRTIEGYGGRLRALQPTKWLPRQLGGLADGHLQDQVLRAVRGMGWTAPRLWINDPGWAPLVEASGWSSLYDITDDWLLADRGEREHRRLVAAESVLLSSCAEVVVCSSALEHSKGATRDVHLIRNAVDVARYRLETPRPNDVPNRPIALYAGTLHEDRLDVDLVAQTGSRLEAVGAELVLLGPDALNPVHSSTLRSTPGVTMLGARSWQTIPSYLQHAHTLVVPHVVDDFTDSLDPIKLYEYLAVGRPIVSTAVAGFRDNADQRGIVIASGKDFGTAVIDAVSEWQPGFRHDEVPDWSDRAAAMRVVVDSLAGDSS